MTTLRPRQRAAGQGELVASAQVRRTLFWSAAGALGYTYLLFPLVLLLRAALRPKPHASGEDTPTVTIVIAAHNEAASIRAKLLNLLSLDYPAGRLEIVIASDGSDDGTDEIVRSFEERGVRLLSLPRVGKAAALNAAVAAAAGEVLVFSDANSMYAPDAVRALVRPLADPGVGGVAGDQRYTADPAAAAVASGEQRYWDLDRALKEAESRAGNVISATGAIYAVRRTLFRPVPPGVTDDFYTSTGVIEQGYRLVFTRDAVAYEPVARTGDIEFGRKVRVMTRGLRGVFLRRGLLDPRRQGFYAIQLLTHKLLRRVMVFPLAVTAVTSPLLWPRGRLYRLATIAQGTLYGLGGAGFLLADKPLGRRRVFFLPTFFCFVNVAAATAAWNLIRGRRIDRWEPRRSSEVAPPADLEGLPRR
jgi:glycosyltransferase involved in cell wall biosynthesis